MNITPVNNFISKPIIKNTRRVAMAALLSVGVIASANATTKGNDINYQASKTAAEASSNYGKASVNINKESKASRIFWGASGVGAFIGGIVSIAHKKNKDE